MNTLFSVLNPGILFFLLGLFATLVGSNLTIPDSVVKFISLYLMLSIGFKGGVSLHHSNIFGDGLIIIGIVMHAEASRNELMLAAKERGVKNFRVLNKQELADVLKNIGDQKAVDAIVAGAVARWKSGWGKKKVQNESQS